MLGMKTDVRQAISKFKLSIRCGRARVKQSCKASCCSFGWTLKFWVSSPLYQESLTLNLWYTKLYKQAKRGRKIILLTRQNTILIINIPITTALHTWLWAMWCNVNKQVWHSIHYFTHYGRWEVVKVRDNKILYYKFSRQLDWSWAK